MFQSLSKQNLNEQIQKWNDKCSVHYPHCSVCLYFKHINEQSNMIFSMDDNNENQSTIPINSEIIVAETSFTKRSSHKSKLPTEAVHFKKDKIDCLLKCKECKLIVHQSKKKKKKQIFWLNCFWIKVSLNFSV